MGRTSEFGVCHITTFANRSQIPKAKISVVIFKDVYINWGYL